MNSSYFSIPAYLTSDYIEITYLPFALIFGILLNIWNLVRLISQLKARTESSIDLISKRRRKSYVMLTLNLTICDIFILLSYGIGRWSWLLSYRWLGGLFLCKAYHFLSLFGFHLEGYAVVLIALDRTLAVRRSLSHKALKSIHVSAWILLAWLLAALFSTSQWFVWITYEPAKKGFVQCTTVWQAEKFESDLFGNLSDIVDYEKFHNLIHLLTIFWIPFVIIVVGYIFIGYNILLHWLLSKTDKISFCIRRRRITSRVCGTATVVVLCYLAFWFPYNVLQLWQLFDHVGYTSLNDSLQFLNTLIIFNAVLNPVIYGFPKVVYHANYQKVISFYLWIHSLLNPRRNIVRNNHRSESPRCRLQRYYGPVPVKLARCSNGRHIIMIHPNAILISRLK